MFHSKVMLFWAFLFSFLIQIEGARFLGIFPYQVHSSKLVYVALTEELANRGHHLTVISPFPKSSNSSNIEHIQFNIPRPASTGPPKNIYQWTKFFETGVQECETILQLREIQEIIHSTDRTYDAIILQALRSECMLGFGHKYKAPTIQICSFGGIVWMRDWVGSPNPFSYAPVTVLASSDRMDFWERMLNTLINFYWTIVQNYYIVPMHDEVVRKYFDNVSSIPSLLDMLRNTSLLMVNSHFSMNYPKPDVPGLIEVGGIHLKPPKALPQDLQEFIDNSSEGVIYFSIGSSVKCTNFEKSKINAFLEAFSKIKQRVLWKYETDYLPGKSENVKISKWLPQNDILGHPNVRLFISHGGLLSMQEALNSGVPIVGIPIYADQHQNVIRAQIGGYGITLVYDNLTAESVLWAINTALLPQYREQAQRYSRIFRDQPLKPLDKAVYWTEYVIRHKGAPHMRSAALDLTWYQYFLLDVIVVLALAAASISYLVFLLIKALFWTYLKICIKKNDGVVMKKNL